MTCREKLKFEHANEIGDGWAGGCNGCPHHYGYLDRPHYCAAGIGKDAVRCTKCWDREIPGTEETKEKNMELNEKFAKMTFAELVDTAASYEKEIEELKKQLIVKKDLYNMAVNDRILIKGHLDAKEGKIKGLEDTIDIIEREKQSRIKELHEKIENLKDTIESKNGLIGTLKQKNELLLKDNQKDKEKIESLEKDISNYRDIIAMRDRRLDEKEADNHNLRETIEFYERHTNRIEGELKLYKGMKVDNDKTDYTTKPEKVEPLCKYIPSNRVIGTLESAIIEEEGIRATILLTEEAAECFMPNGLLPNLGSDIKVGDLVEPAKLRTMPDIDEMHEYKGHNDPVGEPGEPGIPICMSVRSSAVIGKLKSYNPNRGTDLNPEVTFKLPKDALYKLIGEIPAIGKEYLIMPTDIYKDILNKDLEEHMKKYRDMINQYMYYSRFLNAPCMNITPSTPSTAIPPVAKDYKAIGEHIHRKFAALMDAGFTEDQAMSLIPMWTDDEEN